MQENTNEIQSDQSDSQSVTQDQQDGSKWTAEQLEQRLKAVKDEAKTNRKRYIEEKQKREELEKRAMAENGQYKELAEVWQRKAEDAEKLAVQIKDAFAEKSIADTVIYEAKQMGCHDPEVLLSVVNLREFPLDERFNVDKTHVVATLEDLRKKKSYLFQKPGPKIADSAPAKPEPPKFDLGKLSLKEKATLLTQLKMQGK